MRTRQFCCFFLLLFLALVMNGQEVDNANSLPALQDWFLATDKQKNNLSKKTTGKIGFWVGYRSTGRFANLKIRE